MPISILEQQQRLMEVGRLRLGRQIETRSGKKRPTSLDTWRLTSPDRQRIADAAQLYGGTLTQWESPTGRTEWEVVTTADRLPVIVPPSAMCFSQFFELWSAAGCQRRCDSITELISDQPCICDQEDLEHRKCEPRTRLSVMLRDIKGLGLWRLDTQGIYAALELKGSVEVISLAAGKGQMLPATLRIDQRASKRPDEGTRHYVVPVLDIDVTPAELLMGTIAVQSPKQAALTPVPASGEKPTSIADQVGGAQNIPSRRRAQPIPATGVGHRALGPAQVIAGAPEPMAQAGRAAGGQFAEPDPWKAVDDAREAAEATQDPPRMCTRGQLTKLGILLGKQGFTDKSPEGKAARMDFCREALLMLADQGVMKRETWTGRPMKSSIELTFDEAHHLIEFFEAAEKQQAEQAAMSDDSQTESKVDDAPEPEPAEPEPAEDDTSEQSVQELIAGLDPVDEPPESDAPAEEDPNQLSLLSQEP